MDKGAWWSTVHGTAKSWTQPSPQKVTNLLVLVWSYLNERFINFVEAGIGEAIKKSKMILDGNQYYKEREIR